MLSMSECFKEIIEQSMHQYAKLGQENCPQSMRIVVQAPRISGQTLLPPIIIDVGMFKDSEHVYAMILRLYTVDMSQQAIDALMSQLSTMEQILEEYLYDDEEDDEDE